MECLGDQSANYARKGISDRKEVWRRGGSKVESPKRWLIAFSEATASLDNEILFVWDFFACFVVILVLSCLND